MKNTLYVEYDKQEGTMSCRCDATIDELVVMTAYLLRQQYIMNAKEEYPEIYEKCGQKFLHEVANNVSKRISKIIEFGEE